MPNSLEIRQYAPTDRGRVLELHEQALREAGGYVEGAPEPDLEHIQESYFGNGGEFLVGEIDNELVAMGAYRPVSGYITGFVDDVPDMAAEVKRMRVDPARQQQGFGQAMYDELERRAIQDGFRAFLLDTTAAQTAAQRFYEANFFKLAHRATLQFEDHERELLFYQKSLES